ncbi:MAG: hypothetical protein KJT03_18370, partial [Verrucomicrobiae bacterium]|nr:hypothetical protein [Verrucomicrobiae bacterium]
MIRLNFAVGLTVILLLMLILGGFTVIQTRKHSQQVSTLMSENYETINSGQRMLQTFTGLDALYLSVPDREDLPEDRKEWEAAHNFISRYVTSLQNNREIYEDPELITSITVKVERYLELFSKYLDPKVKKSEEEFRDYQQKISELRQEIDGLILDVFRDNETAMFERRDRLARSVNTTALIVIMIVLGSLIVYLLTSFQMTRSIIYPLMDLKEGIAQVRQKHFDIEIQQPKSRELSDIAESFNFMAAELRKFYAEADHKVMVATKTSQRIINSLPYPNYVIDESCELFLINPLAEKLNTTIGATGLPNSIRAKAMEAISQNRDLFVNGVDKAVALGSGDTSVDVLPQIFRISQGN